jgi:glycosyltransferase involved in cell wall biosynthesis
MEACLFVCPPSSIQLSHDVPTAGFTMHELDHLPEAKKGWPEILNRLDLLITPTSWNRRIWEIVGVEIPIDVIPLGVDIESFFPVTGRRCVFLSVHENLGGGSSRENWRDTLTAYCSAFSQGQRVCLRIKTWKWKPELWEAAVAETRSELGLTATTAPPVEVVSDALSPAAMREMYQGAWLFVKNANREGWSLPCTEAVACGTTVAATRIQPLQSHLPDSTLWFEPGDAVELRFLLRREHQRFEADLRRCHRHATITTAKLVERSLTALVQRGRLTR